jgi:hypothetical protein
MSKQTLVIKSVTFSNVKWDTDGEDVNLPKEVTIKTEDLDIDLEDGDAKENIAMQGADTLSDKYGWCVKSFDFEINY